MFLGGGLSYQINVKRGELIFITFASSLNLWSRGPNIGCKKDPAMSTENYCPSNTINKFCKLTK